MACGIYSKLLNLFILLNNIIFNIHFLFSLFFCRKIALKVRNYFVSFTFLIKNQLSLIFLGKLDKKKFIDVYKQFYPHGKADKFCG